LSSSPAHRSHSCLLRASLFIVLLVVLRRPTLISPLFPHTPLCRSTGQRPGKRANQKMRGPTARPNNEKTTPQTPHDLTPIHAPRKKRQRRSALQPRVGRTIEDLPWDQHHNTPNRNAVPPVSSCPSETTRFRPKRKNHHIISPRYKTPKNAEKSMNSNNTLDEKCYHARTDPGDAVLVILAICIFS